MLQRMAAQGLNTYVHRFRYRLLKVKAPPRSAITWFATKFIGRDTDTKPVMPSGEGIS